MEGQRVFEIGVFELEKEGWVMKNPKYKPGQRVQYSGHLWFVHSSFIDFYFDPPVTLVRLTDQRADLSINWKYNSGITCVIDQEKITNEETI